MNNIYMIENGLLLKWLFLVWPMCTVCHWMSNACMEQELLGVFLFFFNSTCNIVFNDL